jgi:hypothetical protein
MVAWYWLFAALLGGALLGVTFLCLGQICKKRVPMPVGGRERWRRPRRMAELDSERRVIALSMTRVK